MMNRWKLLPLLGFITTIGSGTTHAWQLPPASQESEQNRQNAENNRKYIAGLVERCETELKGKDAKQCYEWASNPPQWTLIQGKISYPLSHPEIMERAYTLAIQRDPTLAPAYCARGNLLKKETDLTRAIQLAPEYVHPYLSRGHLLLQERAKQAEADFSEGIKLLIENHREVQTISGLTIQFNRERTLLFAYQDRSHAHLLLGLGDKAQEDVRLAIGCWEKDSDLRKSMEHASSNWMLELAWAAVVHPDEKVRQIKLAEECLSKARSYAAKEPPEDRGYLRTAYRFEIIEAAIAAEKGDFKRAFELEAKVRYGNIQWATPGRCHLHRISQYEAQKPLREKSFWFVE